MAQGTDEDYKDAEVPMRLTEDEIVASLPPWTTQITLRACLVGVVLGVAFQFVTMRFALGPGGVVPTFNMPMGAPAGNVVQPSNSFARAMRCSVPSTCRVDGLVLTCGDASGACRSRPQTASVCRRISRCTLHCSCIIGSAGLAGVGSQPPMTQNFLYVGITTPGVGPTSSAVPAGLTAFLVLKPLTTWLLRAGWSTQPFTAQENTVVQTFAMAMVTSLWILGFGSYLQAMDYQTYVNIGGASTPGNYAADVSNPCALCSCAKASSVEHTSRFEGRPCSSYDSD